MSRPADPSRRAFLTGRSGIAAGERRLGPAPPWLDGRISPDTCRSCEAPCVAACPEGIVTIHPEAHPAGFMAYLDFAKGACTFCRSCVEVCPQAPDDLAAGRPLPPIRIDDALCLAAQGVVCVICVARCPERALSGKPGGRIRVSTETCTGCGACVPACPADALSV